MSPVAEAAPYPLLVATIVETSSSQAALEVVDIGALLALLVDLLALLVAGPHSLETEAIALTHHSRGVLLLFVVADAVVVVDPLEEVPRAGRGVAVVVGLTKRVSPLMYDEL